jgi:hypothetical protein
MKLKEYPIFCAKALRLRLLSHRRLFDTARPTAPLVVSLTSILSRLSHLHLPLRSLLAQTLRPERIVLWLPHALASRIPSSLQRLVHPPFEIRFTDLDCPHLKLVGPLGAFPDRVVVTSDDDLLYEPTWLERLFHTHRQFPDRIIAHECRLIGYDSHGSLLPYTQWPTVAQPGHCAPALLPLGFAGVLYPPHALPPETTDADLFLRLAPTADDLWFKAMALRRGTLTMRALHPGPKPCPLAGTQSSALARQNVRQDANRRQWQALCDHFGFNLTSS